MSNTIDRRSFSVAMAYAMLGGAAITLSSACGGGSTTSPTGGNYGPGENTPTPTPATSDKVGLISNNHGHAATITAAQLDAGGALTLDIKGTAPHDHKVTLTADQVANVKAGQTVTVASTIDDGGSSYGGDHSHNVTFN